MPETPLQVGASRRPRRPAAASRVPLQVSREALEVEPELAPRSRAGRAARASPWWASSRSCISQNAPCARGRLGGLGGELGVRVDVVERQVPPDVAQVAEVGEQLADRPARPGRSRGTRSRRTRRRVTGASCGPRMWSRSGSTGTARSTSASALAAAGRAARARRGSSAVAPEDQPGEQRRRTSAAASTPSFASSQLDAVEGQRRDQQRDREADAGDRAAAGHRRPADRRPQAAAAQPRRQPGGAEHADRLAEHVADDDAERDRRGVGPGRGSRR